MRIAAISDVHGHYGMLSLAWQKLYKIGLLPCQTQLPILNAGDNVGYGSEDNECIDFLRDPVNNILSVSGNYDRNVAQFPQKQESFLRKWGYSRPEKFDAIRLSSDAITDQNRAWLEGLPKTIQMAIGETNFIVHHYQPNGTKRGLFDFTPDDEFREIADQLSGSAQVVITGHTHTGYVKFIDGVLFVNPGSLGRPLGEPTFAVIDISDPKRPTGELVLCQD